MGDTWKPIDYSQKASTWMEPLKRGETTGMVEIPANWDLDDLPPMMFIKESANSQGFVDAHVIEQKWKDHFTYLYQNEPEGFVLPLTIHPDVSGRPHVLLMLDRFISWVNSHDNVEWVPMKDIAQRFRENNKVPEGARIPLAAKI